MSHFQTKPHCVRVPNTIRLCHDHSAIHYNQPSFMVENNRDALVEFSSHSFDSSSKYHSLHCNASPSSPYTGQPYHKHNNSTALNKTLFTVTNVR